MTHNLFSLPYDKKSQADHLGHDNSQRNYSALELPKSSDFEYEYFRIEKFPLYLISQLFDHILQKAFHKNSNIDT